MSFPIDVVATAVFSHPVQNGGLLLNRKAHPKRERTVPSPRDKTETEKWLRGLDSNQQPSG